MPIETRQADSSIRMRPATFNFLTEQLAEFDALAARVNRGKSELMREALNILLIKYELQSSQRKDMEEEDGAVK